MKIKKFYFFCAFLILDGSFFAFGQQRITFKTSDIPPVKGTPGSLFLAGDFNNWNPSDTLWRMTPGTDKAWSLSRQLTAGIYNFKITRGSWQTVECAANGKPVDNRVVHVVNDTLIMIRVTGWQDNFKQPEKKHTASAQVHIISDDFYIPQLDRKRRIWIYLPKDYNSSGKRYPVIYMQDGQNLFDSYTSGYGEWGVDEILDKVPANKQCLIIGIDHGGDNRITEYDPYDSKYGKGRGDDYAVFLAKTLKPYIDRHYRTKKDVKFTTVAGSSMGGLISMYTALKYPHIFGNAGIFSPAFWIAPDIYKEAEETPPAAGSRFYFVCGDSESAGEVAETQKMADIIRQKSPVKLTPVIVKKGAQHNEAQWNADFPAFYDWLTKGYGLK